MIYRFEVFRPAPPDTYIPAGHANPPDEAQYEGVIFTDETVVIRWRTPYKSHSVWSDLHALLMVHGHPEYGTFIGWIDAPPFPINAQGFPEDMGPSHAEKE